MHQYCVKKNSLREQNNTKYLIYNIKILNLLQNAKLQQHIIKKV